MKRYVIHIDIDAFFAAVEVLLDPSLRNKPVIVGGLAHERGVASTCSYEAREYGVHSGMPLRQCAKLCPQAVFVRGNYQVYQAFSEKFFKILHACTPDVEEASLDEAYLEFTHCRPLYHSFSAAALDLKHRVERELGLTVSIGAASNKILAKLATRKAKPGGFFEVREGQEQAFLSTLGIEALPGIGPKAQVLLRLMNIQTFGDLWKLSRATLRSILGSAGDEIYLQSRGLDYRPLSFSSLPKSISRETTFLEDLWDEKLLLAHLAYLCDRLAAALRRENLNAHVIETKVRYANFQTEVRRRLVLTPLQALNSIYKIARELFIELFQGSRLALRLVGVKASELVRAKPLALFETRCSEKPEKLGLAIDSLRKKYGFGAVLTAREKMLDAVYDFDLQRGYVLKTASLTK